MNQGFLSRILKGKSGAPPLSTGGHKDHGRTFAQRLLDWFCGLFDPLGQTAHRDGVGNGYPKKPTMDVRKRDVRNMIDCGVALLEIQLGLD